VYDTYHGKTWRDVVAPDALMRVDWVRLEYLTQEARVYFLPVFLWISLVSGDTDYLSEALENVSPSECTASQRCLIDIVIKILEMKARYDKSAARRNGWDL
jgi:hypothetical protein